MSMPFEQVNIFVAFRMEVEVKSAYFIANVRLNWLFLLQGTQCVNGALNYTPWKPSYLAAPLYKHNLILQNY